MGGRGQCPCEEIWYLGTTHGSHNHRVLEKGYSVMDKLLFRPFEQRGYDVEEQERDPDGSLVLHLVKDGTIGLFRLPMNCSLETMEEAAAFVESKWRPITDA